LDDSPLAAIVNVVENFAVTLAPVMGQGNLDNVFKATLITRAETATVTVTDEDDPITHHTTAVAKPIRPILKRVGRMALYLDRDPP
jgi:hypothetical protein